MLNSFFSDNSILADNFSILSVKYDSHPQSYTSYMQSFIPNETRYVSKRQTNMCTMN